MEHKEKWDLRLMEWKDFSTAVVDQEGSQWDLICQAHLVIGGVDFSDNFVWVTELCDQRNETLIESSARKPVPYMD